MNKEYYILITNLAIGLSFFLYGMKLLGDGLQKAAGDSLRKILKMLTDKTINGVLVGLAITSIIQSSSATTVMVVAFVNAGLMSLKQAMGVIFGANIGTTITAQIIAFKLDKIVWIFLIIGILMEFFVKRKTSKAIGEAILGFGILFFGLYFMSSALAPLKTNEKLINFLVEFGKIPILGIFAGALFTGVIQSSSVTTSLVVALSLQNMIGLPSAIPLILGANIGTTITAGIASIGTKIASRRAALVHFLFNFMGVIIIFPFLKPFVEVVQQTSSFLPRQVANAHTFFNITMALVAVILIKPFEKLVLFLLPPQPEEKEEKVIHYIDDRILVTPSVALSSATDELYRMGEIAYSMVSLCKNALFENKVSLLKDVLQKEELVNALQREITDYLTKITEHDLSEEQGARLLALMHAVNDIERVGDHSTNLVELIEIKDDKKLSFPDESFKDLETVFLHVMKTFQTSLDALKDYELKTAKMVKELEDETDRMTKSFTSNNITRLNERKIYPQAGVILVDILSNLERISDHSDNIADVVMGIY